MGTRISTYELWEDTHFQTIALALLVPYSPVFPLKSVSSCPFLVALPPLLNFSSLEHFSLNSVPSLVSGLCPMPGVLHLIGTRCFLTEEASGFMFLSVLKYLGYFKVS